MSSTMQSTYPRPPTFPRVDGAQATFGPCRHGPADIDARRGATAPTRVNPIVPWATPGLPFDRRPFAAADRARTGPPHRPGRLARGLQPRDYRRAHPTAVARCAQTGRRERPSLYAGRMALASAPSCCVVPSASWQRQPVRASWPVLGEPISGVRGGNHYIATNPRDPAVSTSHRVTSACLSWTAPEPADVAEPDPRAAP